MVTIICQKAEKKLTSKKIGKDAVVYSVYKPFSNRTTRRSLLRDISAVFTLSPDKPNELIILDLGYGTGWTSNFFCKKLAI